MFFSKSSLAIVAAIVAAVQANDGTAFLNGTSVSTRSCGVCNTNTPFRVALPTGGVNPLPACCSTVSLSFNGINTQGTYTDNCLSCSTAPNGVDGDIALSRPLYVQFGQPPPSFGPIVWNV